MFQADQGLVAALVLALLAMVFVGMGATVLGVAQGEAPPGEGSYRDRFLLVAPPTVFLALVLLLGLFLPEPLRQLLEEAAALLEVHA